jgi:hypothetical protein
LRLGSGGTAGDPSARAAAFLDNPEASLRDRRRLANVHAGDSIQVAGAMLPRNGEMSGPLEAVLIRLGHVAGIRIRTIKYGDTVAVAFERVAGSFRALTRAAPVFVHHGLTLVAMRRRTAGQAASLATGPAPGAAG